MVAAYHPSPKPHVRQSAGARAEDACRVWEGLSSGWGTSDLYQTPQKAISVFFVPPPDLLLQYPVVGRPTPPWGPRRGRRDPDIHSVLVSADFYVARRQLGWLGHVARMDYSRLPRRMLSCWVAHQRPRGAPRMTYGRSVRKALDTFNLDPNKWPELAADRLAWRAMLRSGEPPPYYRAPPRA